MAALYTTVSELCERRDLAKNARTIEPCHLHYNGPGAAGFGVKKTAMLLPESVMLLVAPSCCGRHGTVTGNKSGFDSRMFYLEITERDLVTGKYLQRIPEAARLVAEHQPKAIFLCMTCVDALMGTDLQRIARQVEAETGIRTVGSFMDPIAREGRRAPMVSVQTAIMSCLERRAVDPNCADSGYEDLRDADLHTAESSCPDPRAADPHAANIVGNFVPLDDQSELYELLRSMGFTTIRQISACETYEEYMRMAEASLNVVINPQAVAAAEDMEERLGIPFVHIRNCFGPERIRIEEESLISAMRQLGIERLPEEQQLYETEHPIKAESLIEPATLTETSRLRDARPAELKLNSKLKNINLNPEYKKAINSARSNAEGALSEFRRKYGGLKFAVGEAVNGSNIELALTLLEAGLNVEYVLKNIVTDYDLQILKKINEIKPELRVYSGVHPSVGRGYEGHSRADECDTENKSGLSNGMPQVDVAIGLDAGYLSPESSSVCWSTEQQYFGYSGLVALLEEITARIENPIQHKEQISGSYLTV